MRKCNVTVCLNFHFYFIEDDLLRLTFHLNADFVCTQGKYLLADCFGEAHADADVISQLILHPQSHTMTASSPETAAELRRITITFKIQKSEMQEKSEWLKSELPDEISKFQKIATIRGCSVNSEENVYIIPRF